MEIVNPRRKMLDAMESNAKGNDNFAIKLISTENIERKRSIKKNKEEVRGKSQTCLFPFSKFKSYLLWKSIMFLKF